MVAEKETAPVGSLPGRVLDSRWTPRGVYPVNSPRAGRQQGSMGSGGCAGSPMSIWQPGWNGERWMVSYGSFSSLGRTDLEALHARHQQDYAELQSKKLAL